MTEHNLPEDVEAGMVEDDEVIRGKVVDFVNNREIIMNVGKANGVKIGMQFVVLVPGGVPVEFGEGDEKFVENVEVPKAVVKVVRFSGERLSIGRTFMTIKGRPAYEIRNPMYPGSSLASLGEAIRQIPAVPDRIETFDVDRKDTIRADVDLEVRKGDEVRLTTGDEFIFPG
ncbi:hypothetical protein [Mycobacterium sp.]|uniref:hypothetical protein n=1 Tax=Mycobacterium sp. TaxID=1785 RepID=UPI003F98E60A